MRHVTGYCNYWLLQVSVPRFVSQRFPSLIGPEARYCEQFGIYTPEALKQ